MADPSMDQVDLSGLNPGSETVRSLLEQRFHETKRRLDEARPELAEANRIWPHRTVRTHWPDDPSNKVHAAQIARFQAAMQPDGHRDHADEGADFSVPPKRALRRNVAGPAPSTVPGANIIRTPDLAAMLGNGSRLSPTLRCFPGAVRWQAPSGCRRLWDLPALSMTRCRIGSVRR